ncbi:MAG: type II toxin-antitoxin system RelE/ParE family toxin [Clostridia bacterium]|nr:type II toxin-antitoxin system RelE/ParE family toxin [Clostridia bacterium]MDD4048737.1 type II toxin-antitoxin system RelE/ParE family toxin [Clostridia bacterium]
MIKLYEIEYYIDNGKFPVVEFIKRLNSKEQAKILREIDLLQEFGLFLGPPHIKKLEGRYKKIWELRIKQSTNDFRIFYFSFNQGKFVLLHGIRKTSNSTPQNALDISLKRMNNYLKGCEQ